MNYQSMLRDVARAVRKERVLDALGLESRDSSGGKTLNALGLLGIGLLAGAALGLLLAPTPGEQLRRDLARRLGLEDDEDIADVDEETLDELIT